MHRLKTKSSYFHQMIVLLFLYEICIFLPIFFVATILCALVTSVGCTLGNAHFWGFWPPHYWSKFGCWLALCPVKVEGLEKIDRQTSYVFVANHTGAFDIFLLYGYMKNPFRWMLRKEIRKIPIVGKACDISGQIWVDSHGNKGLLTTMRQALNTLKDGTSLIVFPEGTRTQTGRLNPFKRGAFGLAAMVKLPVVPITITGPFHIMQKGSFLIHPHRMTLTIHDPIPAVTREEGQEAGVDRLLLTSQKVIADSLGEPVPSAK